jgi:hypothetical protein
MTPHLARELEHLAQERAVCSDAKSILMSPTPNSGLPKRNSGRPQLRARPGYGEAQDMGQETWVLTYAGDGWRRRSRG